MGRRRATRFCIEHPSNTKYSGILGTLRPDSSRCAAESTCDFPLHSGLAGTYYSAFIESGKMLSPPPLTIIMREHIILPGNATHNTTTSSSCCGQRQLCILSIIDWLSALWRGCNGFRKLGAKVESMPLGWLKGRAVVDARFIDYCVCQGGKRPIRLGSGDGSADKKRLTH
ncbi:hypothetical protein GGI43DRAFT_140403 [Trichoderma evansii]